MNPMFHRDREATFDDAVKFAAAVVLVGVLVAFGEGTQNRHPVPAVEAPAVANVAPTEYFPAQFEIQAGEPEAHVEAF